MPRPVRRQSESSIYHVINRGEGGQIVFEDDADRAFFIKRLRELLAAENGLLLAWCLMDNHFHILISIPFERLRVFMHRLQTSYAGYFNRVHSHIGSVFAGRFKSEPVESDEYLMTVVRYIHENPRKAGTCRELDFPWSSYREYSSSTSCADTSFVFDIFGGREQFEAFHNARHADESCLEIAAVPRRSLNDAEARRIADELLGNGVSTTLKWIDRTARDKAIGNLKEKGLSVRQIQRLTGISLGAISKAGK